MGLHPVGESPATEPHDAKGRVGKRRDTGPTFDRHPNLGRELRADAMNTERRKETDHPPRYCSGHDSETVVFGYESSRESVLASRNTLKDLLRHQPSELLAVNTGPDDFTRRDDTTAFGEIEEPIAVGLGHVCKCTQIYIYVNIFTQDKQSGRLLRLDDRRWVAESINLTLVPLPGVRVEIVGVAINVGETSPVVFDGSINLSARLVHGCRALHPVDLVGESSLKFEPVPLCFVEMTTFDQIDDAVREPFE
jgi:hypothetical protein